jgi:septal ring-binding cell division protein DamX
MSCLNPPLTRKPSKGFAWQCAFCTRQEADSAPQSPVASSSTPATVESPVVSRPTSKSPSIVKDTTEETSNSSSRARTRTTRSQLMRQSSSTAVQKQTTPEATKNIRLKLLNNNIGSGSVGSKIADLKSKPFQFLSLVGLY